MTSYLTPIYINSVLFVPNLEEGLERSWERRNRASGQCTEIITAFFQLTDKTHLHKAPVT